MIYLPYTPRAPSTTEGSLGRNLAYRGHRETRMLLLTDFLSLLARTTQFRSGTIHSKPPIINNKEKKRTLKPCIVGNVCFLTRITDVCYACFSSPFPATTPYLSSCLIPKDFPLLLKHPVTSATGLCIHSVTMQILHEIAFFNRSSLDNPGLYRVNKTKQWTPSLFGLQGALGRWWGGRFAKAEEEPRKRAGVHGVTGPEVWQKDCDGIRLRGFFVGNYQTSHPHPEPLVESKDFGVVGQSARTDSQSALARNKNGCLFVQLPSSCGKLTRKAGGFLSSLPALKFDSWLIFLASLTKAHWDRRHQAAAGRRTDKWSNREDGQTPTASFCPSRTSGAGITQQT